jgi:peroxiredoxin
LTAATAEDAGWLGELLFLSGAQTDGLEIVQDHAKRRGNEVVPLARLAYLQYESGDLAGAQQSLQRINNASSKIDWAIPLFARLRPAMENAGHEESVPGLATTVGLLNSSDDVMPRWEPARAPTWQLVDSEDRTVDSSDYNGRAHLLIFYLGHGCLHCVQQLQALGPREPEFRAAGVEMIAISIESHDNLKESVQALGSQMPIRLMSNPLLDVFRSHGAFDAGEQKPLHGTFLIDSHGLIRWQDIRTEPFMDIDFLLAEARRLL